jgi:hypothetical protein
MNPKALPNTHSQLRRVALTAGVVVFLGASQPWIMASEAPPVPEKATPKEPGNAPAKPVVKDERPPGGDGSMFFKVFVSRNDKNGDGIIQKSEFRGGGVRFDQMDKNKNEKLDRAEIDELHRTRMADPLSMRQRIARGETRQPPIDPPTEPKGETNGGDDGEPSALTPLGTRITAKQAYARLDVDKNGKVTASEFQKSPGMAEPEKAKQTVAKLDRDGDGSLSFSEFNTVFAKRHAKQPNAKAKPEPAEPSPK